MPFCTGCGNQVGDADAHCRQCGAAQAGRAAAHAPDPMASISPRTAKLLCYLPVIGWVAAIVVLSSEKHRKQRDVRFHAFQGIYLFVAWMIVRAVIDPVFDFFPGRHPLPVGDLLSVFLFGVWIFMLVKVSQEQDVRLPLLGELADRSVSEQR